MVAPPDPDRWTNRAKTLSTMWTAARAPLCWTLAALLTIGEAVGSFLGHPIDPQIVILIGGLFGLPFFFVSQGGHQ